MIEIIRQDETGAAEARFSDSAVVHELLPYVETGSRCLVLIDPYGDTTFNQLQIPVLIEELRALSSVILNDEVTSRIENLIQFIECAREEPHMYIKFVGD